VPIFLKLGNLKLLDLSGHVQASTGIVVLFRYRFYRRVYSLSCLDSPSASRFHCCWGFVVTLRHPTPGSTSPDESLSHRRDLYLTTHNTHKRQVSMLSAGIEPAIPESELPQTILNLAATGVGRIYIYSNPCIKALPDKLIIAELISGFHAFYRTRTVYYPVVHRRAR
jgi:hypothetical protein